MVFSGVGLVPGMKFLILIGEVRGQAGALHVVANSVLSENIELEPIFNSSRETSTNFNLFGRHINMCGHTSLCLGSE
jgi:hypothetical protein